MRALFAEKGGELNPYDYTAPTRGASDYIGRRDLLARVPTWLESGAFLSITGPRRMGTTSTLNLLLELWREIGARGVYLDLRSVTQTNSGDSIVAAVMSLLGAPDATNAKAIPEVVKTPLSPFVVALDEFDLVAGPDAHSVLTTLVHSFPMWLQVANSENQGPAGSVVSLICGSRQPLFDIERHTECIDSPCYHVFQSVRLHPLRRTEARSLVCDLSAAAGRPLESEFRWLTGFAGTWPFFLKLACCHAFDRRVENRRLTRAERTLLEEEIWDDALPHLHVYWSFLNSRQRDIAANLDWWRKRRDEARFDPDIGRLAADGICVRTAGGVDFTCDLFRLFFSNVARGERLRGHSVATPEAATGAIVECLGRLGACVAEFSEWDDTSESKIQEVAFMILRAQYERVVREVHVARGPEREYRCDLVVEDVDVLVEVKRVRSRAHAQALQAEIHDDIVGYRGPRPGQRIVFLIWDRERHIGDREFFRGSYERSDPGTRIVFAP